MQQVFTVMNSLLKSNKDAKQRKLYVRTYKVVPLTQRSGVLQWCENTLPLSFILTGDGSTRHIGLHRKYYPNDCTPNDCRKRLHVSDLFVCFFLSFFFFQFRIPLAQIVQIFVIVHVEFHEQRDCISRGDVYFCSPNKQSLLGILYESYYIYLTNVQVVESLCFYYHQLSFTKSNK